MEYWDLYNNNREKVCTIERHEEIPLGLNRLVVHICLFNSKGEMLIQQRHSSKKFLPNVWDITVGGGVKAGETSKEAAHREVLEELGLDVDFSSERKYFTVDFSCGFDDFFLIEKDVNINDVKFVDHEVQAVKWASEEEILKMIDDKQFIQYHKGLISVVFQMKDERGCLKNN